MDFLVPVPIGSMPQSAGGTNWSAKMTIEQVETKIIDLVHREPFVPFLLEMGNGELVEISYPGLAINGGGAGFIGPDGGLVDIEFKNVRSVRPHNSEAVA